MWRVVVPVKRWDTAKSRLDLPSDERRRLAEAMTVDTLTAIHACPEVGSIAVIASSESIRASRLLDRADQVLVQPGEMTSLGEAVTWGVARLPIEPHLVGTAVVVSDLPALRPAELTAALVAAVEHELAMVADRSGTGTTALTVTGPAQLVAHFGEQSAVRHHAAGATSLDEILDDAVAGLRCDVDTLDDLDEARRLGLSGRTLDVDRWLGSSP